MQTSSTQAKLMQAARRYAPYAAPAVVYLILITTGLMGIDFGYHWDEWLNFLKISETVRSNVLLPHWYDYGGIVYWLNLLVLAPTAPLAIRSEEFSLLAYVDTHQYLLQNRVVFLLLASLIVFWVYFGVLEWRKRWPEALLAASLAGFSWEFAYHSRFISPNATMTAMGALTTMFMVIGFHRKDDLRWLRLAALAAGLTTGTKFTAGALVVPLFILTIQCWQRQSVWKLLGMLIASGGLYALGFYLSTPGVLLEPRVFLDSVIFVGEMYSSGHEMHTVTSSGQYIWLFSQYVTFSLLSRYAMPAAVLAVFIPVGIYATIRDSKGLALLLLSFPVSYLGFVLFFGRVMTVRNVLITSSFFAIFAARGIGFAFDALKNRRVRTAFAGVIGALVLVNVGWLFYAADTIRDRGTDRFTQAFAGYLTRHEGSTYFVTERVAAALEDVGYAGDNITRTLSDAADFAAFYGNADTPVCVPANRRFMVRRWFGPYEINYRYYPNWAGEDHIVILPIEDALAISEGDCLPE